MDKKAATELATRLHEQLGGKVLRVRPHQVNPHSGDASIGWAVQVVREDGSDVDVIGSEASGFSTMQRTGGFVSLDRILAEIVQGDEPESDAPAEPTLIERMTALAAGLAEMGREVAAVRDELVLRGVQ